MSDQPKLDRLLQLLIMLSGSFGYTMDEIAERLQISKRTAYRYIDTLRNAGFIIVNKEGYLRVDKESPYFKEISDLLHFTKEESWILNKAILALDDETFIKQNLARKLYSLYDLKGVPYPVAKKENSERVIGLIRAIEDRKQVILAGYQSSHSSTVNDRLVEPFEFTLNYGYVWCFEHETESNKLFKIARIRQVITQDDEWIYEDRHEAGRTDVFRISGNEQIAVSLLMTMRAANLLTEEYPMAEAFIKACGGNEYIFEGWVTGYEGVGRFILGLMDEVTVIGPEELKEFLNRKVEGKKF